MELMLICNCWLEPGKINKRLQPKTTFHFVWNPQKDSEWNGRYYSCKFMHVMWEFIHSSICYLTHHHLHHPSRIIFYLTTQWCSRGLLGSLCSSQWVKQGIRPGHVTCPVSITGHTYTHIHTIQTLTHSTYKDNLESPVREKNTDVTFSSLNASQQRQIAIL